MKIVGGISMAGTDIYVSEEDAGKAKEIIEGIVGTSDDSEEESGELRRYELKRRLFAIITLLFLLAAIIMGVIFA